MKETVIKTEKLTKRFGDFVAANEISFEVYKGEIFGFLGANGAGKTTAMRMLCGLSTPSSGKAVIAGYDVYRQTELIKKNIGYMSQKFSLYDDLTVLENIHFFGGIYGLTDNQLKTKSEALIDQLGLQKEVKKISCFACRWDGNRNYLFQWPYFMNLKSYFWMNQRGE